MIEISDMEILPFIDGHLVRCLVVREGKSVKLEIPLPFGYESYKTLEHLRDLLGDKIQERKTT
jgi:hypothetical protein